MTLILEDHKDAMNKEVPDETWHWEDIMNVCQATNRTRQIPTKFWILWIPTMLTISGLNQHTTRRKKLGMKMRWRTWVFSWPICWHVHDELNKVWNKTLYFEILDEFYCVQRKKKKKVTTKAGVWRCQLLWCLSWVNPWWSLQRWIEGDGRGQR